MADPTISFDPATGKIVELVPQELAESEFQAKLDEAQNRLNAANEVVPAKEAEYADAVALVEAKSLELENARKEVEEAATELQFQTDRKAQFDEAVRVRDEVATSTPEDEFTEGESEAVEVEVRLAEDAPA